MTEPAVVYVPVPAPAYDWKKSAGKLGKGLALNAVAVVVLALGSWLADADAMKAALKDMPAALVLVPILASVGQAVQNWAKHRGQ